MAEIKARNWEIIFYPESCPFDFIEIIEDMKVPACLSPLHDMDLLSDGSPKKPHYHLDLFFDGPVTLEGVLPIAKSLGVGAAQIEKIKSLSGSVRYLSHIDSLSKAQYNPDDIIDFAGFDHVPYYEVKELSKKDKYLLIASMIEYIEENDITEVSSFNISCIHEHYDWWMLMVDSASHIISDHIKSRRHARDVQVRQ